MTTIAVLIDWLKEEGEGYEEAFNQIDRIKIAVNQVTVTKDAPVSDGDEVAFFPPVTGG